jgi:hypothetical protein
MNDALPGGSNSDLLTLTNTQAKSLAGSFLAIGDEIYRFKDYDPAYPGQPPWRSGAEGKAYPLLGRDGSVLAYLKFFTRPTHRRLNRTAWLIGQQMHTWLPGLAAAPLLWVEARRGGRPDTDFAFGGYLAHSVPGETWLELKHRVVDEGESFPDELRWRCVEDLVLATAVLEREGIVHGDLSPNNIVINLNAPLGEPALYLIDFDAFVAPAVGEDRAVSLAEGGTYGTEGYCPPDLNARAEAGDGSVAPYSDRYGRDILMLELLLLEPGLSPDDCASSWNRDALAQRYAAWQASCDPARRQTLVHLNAENVFSLPEAERPTSTSLAAALGLELPESPEVCGDVQVRYSLPAAPAPGSISVYSRRRSGRRSSSGKGTPQSRQAAPSQFQPLNRWLVNAQVVTRTLRRTPKRTISPLQNRTTVLVLATILVLAWLVPLIIRLITSK